MSTANDLNKELIAKTKELLLNKGYEVKTSHLYDVFAQLAGYKNWHTASAKNVALTDTIKKYVTENADTASSEGFLDYIKDTFINQDDQEVKFELMDPTLPAWNYLVSGQTGSGKTVIVKKMIYSALKQHKNPLIVILDYEQNNEYAKLVKLNQGTVINVATDLPSINILDFDPEKSYPLDYKFKEIATTILTNSTSNRSEAEVIICLSDVFNSMNIHNDFSQSYKNELITRYFSKEEYPNASGEILNLKIGECEPAANQKYAIMEFLNLILSNGKTTYFEEFDKDEISKLLTDTYTLIGQKEQRIPRLSDMLKLAIEYKAHQRFIDRLTRWTIDGKYPMFDKATTIDLSKNIILVNFAGLESQKLLKSAYHIILNHLIAEKTKTVKNRIKLVVRNDGDFSDPTYRSYLVENLRTARPNGIATITIAGSPLDMITAAPQDARAVLSNFQVNIFCKFESIEICEGVGREYRLHPIDWALLQTLGIKKDKDQFYNTFMVLRDRKSTVYKNFMSDKEFEYY